MDKAVTGNGGNYDSDKEVGAPWQGLRTLSVIFKCHRDGSPPFLFKSDPKARFQVVFCHRTACITDYREVPGMSGHFVTKPIELVGLWAVLRKAWGWPGLIKTALKLMSGRRKLYLFVGERDLSLASYGWVNIGFCQHYAVAGKDVVIGPIWTAEDKRGFGLATAGLILALQQMRRIGYRKCFIDTRENNFPAIRAILKTGFEPVAAQYRGFEDSD